MFLSFGSSSCKRRHRAPVPHLIQTHILHTFRVRCHQRTNRLCVRLSCRCAELSCRPRRPRACYCLPLGTTSMASQLRACGSRSVRRNISKSTPSWQLTALLPGLSSSAPRRACRLRYRCTRPGCSLRTPHLRLRCLQLPLVDFPPGCVRCIFHRPFQTAASDVTRLVSTSLRARRSLHVVPSCRRRRC